MNNWITKKEEILNTPLPINSDRYGIIPHGVLLNELEEKLNKEGYEIESTKYLTCNNNQIISGVYRLKSDNDLDIKPSITFINSYNRTRKAEIKIGMEVLVCTNGMIGSTGTKYSRKHIGDLALRDFQHHIDLGIKNIEPEIQILRNNVKDMKSIQMTKELRAQLIGDMLINESMINSTQLGIIQKEINFSENFKTNTVWDFYNHITEGYKHNHPMHYDKQHIKLHTYIQDVFSLEGSKKLFKKDFV